MNRLARKCELSGWTTQRKDSYGDTREMAEKPADAGGGGGGGVC